MRFRGGGVGHKAMWDTLAKLSKEIHGVFEDGDDDPMIDGSGFNRENDKRTNHDEDNGSGPRDDEGEERW